MTALFLLTRIQARIDMVQIQDNTLKVLVEF